jgi:hypothetical protein
MAAKLTRLTHKIAIQLHLVAESCSICSSRSRRPVRKLLYTPSYNAVTVPVAAQPNACMVLKGLNTRTVGPNVARMHLCLHFDVFCCPMCVLR